MQFVIERIILFTFTTLMCSRIILSDYLCVNVIFVLIQEVAEFLILIESLSIVFDVIRIHILLIDFDQEITRILILIAFLILIISRNILIVVILLDRVSVSFLSSIPIIIVSILIVSRSFEESILKIVVFLFC
jgi:hypothetical protein